LVAQATAGSNVSNPEEVGVEFFPIPQLQIVMVRVQTAISSAPTRAQYFAAVNKLPMIYPIPTDPGVAIQYWIVSGSEQVFANHDLTTSKGMDDFLDDLEDIQEDTDDDATTCDDEGRLPNGLGLIPRMSPQQHNPVGLSAWSYTY
jgi:hypothetical protein